ncbi:cytochrome c biogenesis CcdA family protein [Humibacter ginsenosidimutans]|uniref:Cytochrome c biogenesis protein CcdA n=1 Tax=Humibacter ginsenosidimutans TaxID=2599293 RepID=A0A5B8M8X0_9MICO|nr:cytochrome c biogenesis protein CcdA [Humibacter ginsenosidimutans]QDZ16072.1 cytochrome c biogenesis protein CcdA [Humibacter ginsenosidimutans]
MGIENFVLSAPLLLTVPVALLAGFISFASPCILPLVPGYLAYIGGFTGETAAAAAAAGVAPGGQGATATATAVRTGRNRLVLGVALFVLGFAVVFVLTGFVFGALGFWMIQWRDLITRIAGIVLIVLGLVFVGQFTFMQRTFKPQWRPLTGLAGAPLLGIIFAIGWSPCTGPTLAAITTMSYSSGSAWQGAVLALFYALGLGVPFVLIALGLGWASGAVAFLRRHIRVINIVGGALLIAIGILMVSGVWNQWISALAGVIPSFGTAL